MVLDPAVHAALIVVFAFFVKLLFHAVGLGDVSADVFTGIAGVIVTYILSLFGYTLYLKAKFKLFGNKQLTINTYTYKPPFS